MEHQNGTLKCPSIKILVESSLNLSVLSNVGLGFPG